jgi:hypothetical protein
VIWHAAGKRGGEGEERGEKRRREEGEYYCSRGTSKR